MASNFYVDKMEHLYEWSIKMQGAREMLEYLHTSMRCGAKICLVPAPRGEGKVYTEAIFMLAMSSIDNTSKFLQGVRISFFNHKRDKKGNLSYVEAAFDW